MSLPIFQRTIVDSSGNIQPGASVAVRNETTGDLVTIYADREGGTAKANPFLADSEGFATFYVEPGEYQVTATTPTGTITWSHVAIGDTALLQLAQPAGDTLVGSDDGASGSLWTTVAGFIEHARDEFDDNVRPSKFGAVGDGVADDAAAIQAADTFASASGKVLAFDGVTYLIKSPLTISAPWVGVAGKTTIRVPPDMVYNTGAADPVRYSALTNKNCSTVYNASTADWVSMCGIKFVDASGAGGLVNVAFANVRGGVIEDCTWTTEKTGAVTLLDLHACVKNLTVQRVRISNLTQNSVGGGCMWVRNITANGALAANDTENIRVLDSYFEQTSLDEAFAVYGVNGMSKNVRVSRCTFNGNTTSTQRHGNLVTAFPLGNTDNAGVQDVVFSECRFESNNFISHVMRVGQTADSSSVCKDIVVRDSYFKASMPTAGTSAVARNIPCVGGNVKFLNNTVEADGSVQQITYGVQRFDVVDENCLVSGNVANAYAECQIMDDCASKSITGAATFNCLRVTNCNLQAATNGIVGNTTARFELLNNKVELTATSGAFNAVFLNSVSSSAPVGEILGNQIVLNNASAYAMRVAGSGMANTRVVNNRVDGTGGTIVGTQLKEVAGNNWFGTLDSVRASAYLNYDHNYATPIGTFAVATTHTAGTSRRLLGWVKIANAGNSSDWVSQFAENANN